MPQEEQNQDQKDEKRILWVEGHENKKKEPRKNARRNDQ